MYSGSWEVISFDILLVPVLRLLTRLRFQTSHFLDSVWNCDGLGVSFRLETMARWGTSDVGLRLAWRANTCHTTCILDTIWLERGRSIVSVRSTRDNRLSVTWYDEVGVFS